jgi:PPK2 family polyphosphate:nucleotide phosphotransferase
MKIKNFKIQKPKKNILSTHKTRMKSPFNSENDLNNSLKKSQDRLSELQELLYAQNNWSVLIVLQGMDTAGKDGLIEHVMKSVNPQGCDVTSFKKPTHLEFDHDFLWRAHANLPQRGKIGVFNRSYYEDVIVPMVHPEILGESQLPTELQKSKSLLKDRCSDIIHFEKYLARQGTVIIKLFLHLSKDEQKNRLLHRLETPEKNWKFEPSDMNERKFWNKYQDAYNFCIQHTSHEIAPWYVIPADDKPMARVVASKIITESLDQIDLKIPKLSAELQNELGKYRAQLKKNNS